MSDLYAVILYNINTYINMGVKLFDWTVQETENNLYEFSMDINGVYYYGRVKRENGKIKIQGKVQNESSTSGIMF